MDNTHQNIYHQYIYIYLYMHENNTFSLCQTHRLIPNRHTGREWFIYGPALRKEKQVTMMTSSNGNIFRVTGSLCGEFTGLGEFPAQRPVTRSFDVFFDLRPNKRLSKQPWGWWFETPSWSLWRHCNESLKYVVSPGVLVVMWYNYALGDVIIHYNDLIMSMIASQITSLTIVYSTVYSGADQRQHQSSVSLAFVRGIHRGPVNSPHKWPVTRKMFPFDDVIMKTEIKKSWCVRFVVN